MNPQTLLAKLDAGEEVIVKHSDGEYIRFTAKEGKYYMCTAWQDTEEGVKESITTGAYIKSSIEEQAKDWTFISSRVRPIPILPVGTKVRILECAEEECRKVGLFWDTTKQAMVGEVFEIQKMLSRDYTVNGWYFPRTAFTVESEEPLPMTDEEMINHLKNVGKIKQGDILTQ